MMQETGSNIDSCLNRILSIRFAPNGLYYSISRGGDVVILNKIPLISGDLASEINSLFTDLGVVFSGDYDAVNVVVDSDEVLFVPETLLDATDLDTARDILELNSIDIAEGSTIVVTESVRGVRGLLLLDSSVFGVFKEMFPSLKLYVTLLSDILTKSDGIFVTVNDCSTSLSSTVGGRLLYADVFSKSVEINTIAYYIQSLLAQLSKKGSELPIYISGSRCDEVEGQIRSVIPSVRRFVDLDRSVSVQSTDIISYNDLIRLCSENY